MRADKEIAECFAGVVGGSLVLAGGMVLALERVFGQPDIGVHDVLAAVLVVVGGFLVVRYSSLLQPRRRRQTS